MNPTFEHYLLQKGFSGKSARRYQQNAKYYLQSVPNAVHAAYKDVLAYLNELNSYGLKPASRQGRLSAIKKYHDYLIETGQREDHPCRRLSIKGKGKKNIIITDLFRSEELEILLNREETFPYLKNKNQVIISLLIYQALLPQEIIAIKLHHIDLDAGMIYVNAGHINTNRKLELHPTQYCLFEKYLHETRKRLLQARERKHKALPKNTPKQKQENTDSFLLNYRGNPITIEDVQFLIETARPLFPDRNLNLKTIRDSVIANMLNERKKPLEQVQLFAGHRWISSTARYLHTSMNEQRELLNKCHPMG